MHVRAFGAVHAVRVTVAREEHLAALRAAWADLVVAGPATPPEVVLTSRATTTDTCLTELTSALTRHLLASAPSDALLLHASAIATDDGRVVGFVGPSGAGKTTLVAALARTHGYVTDEALAIDRSGRVLPYPKPLSIKGPPSEGTGHLAASQHLEALPSADLHLARLVLLERSGTPGPVTVGWLGLAEAIVALVPQTSHLAARSRPLVALATLLQRTGGLRRLTYHEAADVGPVVADLAEAAPCGERWTDLALSSRAVAHVADAIGVGDDTLVLAEGRVAHLRGVGSTIWRAVARGEDPVAAAAAAHGAPGWQSLEEAVAGRLAQLGGHGLVADPPQPAAGRARGAGRGRRASRTGA